MADGQGARLRGQRRTLDDLGLRLTYIPVKNDEDGIGELSRNRVTSPAPRFQQVSPFEQWCPPSKSSSVLPPGPPWRVARLQRKWLLSSHPEACIWDSSMKYLLEDEIAQLKDGTGETTASSSLLSVGEISDVRQVKAVKGQRSIAFASGESGNVLRIVSVTQEEWSWSGEDATVRLNELNDREEGMWSQGERPITLIKFARDYKSRDTMIRWLLVQTASSTTVLDPELRKMPEQKGLPGNPFHQRGALQITANPLFSIPCEETGSEPPSDVSFNPVSYRDWPQLAIIDSSGHWTVWDIECRSPIRPKVWRPVLRARGHIPGGRVPKWSLGSTMTANHHQILWLPRPADDLKTWDEPDDAENPDSEDAGVGDVWQIPRSNLLLLCNKTTLRIFDLRSETEQPVLQLLQATKPHRILAVQRCPLSPSQIFVLTSTTLFLVAAERFGRTTQLTIVLSCSHQRDSTDETLNLSISPAMVVANRRVCLACICSARDAQMSIFGFIKSVEDGSIQYYRDMFLLNGSRGHQTTLMIPARSRTEAAKSAAIKGPSWASGETLFYQLLALGPDLDLSYSLFVWSDQRDVEFFFPDTKLPQKSLINERKRLIEHLGGAFAVPDTFDERTIWANPVSLEEEAAEKKETQGSQSLVRKVGLDVKIPDLFGLDERPGRRDELASRLKTWRLESEVSRAITGTIEEQVQQDGRMPLRTFFDLVGHEENSTSLCSIASRVATEPEELVDSGTRRALFKQIQPDSLLRAYLGIWSTAASNTGSNARQEEIQRDLQRVAALEMLSNLGVSVVPREPVHLSTVSEAEEAEDQEAPPSAQPPPPSSQFNMDSSPPDFSHWGSQREDEDAWEDEQDGDPSINLVRKYTAADRIPGAGGKGPLLVISHWDLGGDTSQLAWKTQEEELDEEDAHQRRRKQETRRRREEKIRAEAALFAAPRGHGGHGGDAGPASTSRMFLSSQARAPADLYQQGSSQSLGAFSFSQPLQPMSQVVPGPHGGRLPKHKKAKGKRGGRAQGFR